MFSITGWREKEASQPLLSFLQTFLRVRANRHTRLNGTWPQQLLCFIAADSVCGWQRALSPTKSVSAALFFFFFYKFGSGCFYSSRHYHAVTPPTRRSASQKWPTPFYFLIFPPHLHRPSAHTSRGAINPFQLWPLDMLTVDDLCWCRCYVKSAPLRPHSAGAHLDCTQAGKTHQEALLSSLTTLLSCISFAFIFKFQKEIK